MNKEKEEIMEDKDKHEDLIKEINDSKILAGCWSVGMSDSEAVELTFDSPAQARDAMEFFKHIL